MHVDTHICAIVIGPGFLKFPSEACSAPGFTFGCMGHSLTPKLAREQSASGSSVLPCVVLLVCRLDEEQAELCRASQQTTSLFRRRL